MTHTEEMIYINPTEEGYWITSEEDQNGIEVECEHTAENAVRAVAKFLNVEDIVSGDFTQNQKETSKLDTPIIAGFITLGDTVDITDPCYDRSTGYSTFKCKPGKYECSYVLTEAWGTRVKECQIVHEDYNIEEEGLWEVAGYTGVDAGLAGFFNNKPDFSDDEWSEFCDAIYHGDAWINPSIAKGFCTSSGYGDGCYDIDVVREGDEIIAARIIFIDEEDEDDE